MPHPVLSAYVEQLPRISAAESMQAAERIAVGTGSLKKGVGRRIANGWARLSDQKAPVIRPKSRAAYRAQMAMTGIGVKTVPKVTADG